MNQQIMIRQQVLAMERLQGLIRRRSLTPKERREYDNVYRDLQIARELLATSHGNLVLSQVPRVDRFLTNMVGRIFRPGGEWVVIRALRDFLEH